MKVLVTGASGLLGEELLRQMPDNIDLIGQFYNHMPGINKGAFVDYNLHNTEAIITLLDRLKPKAVIHTAALTSTGLCEQQPEHSATLNVTATFIIARWCAQQMIPFFFTSTDLIFDGQNPPYDEDAAPNPLMTYGKHKMLAEKKILSVHKKATILRLPLMFGIKNRAAGGVLKFVLDNVQAEKEARFFRDEYRSPVYTKHVAQAIWLFLKKELTGYFNFGGPQRISRYHLALLISDYFVIDSLKIKAGWLSETPLAGERPPDVTLNNAKSVKAGFHPGDLNIDMQEVANELKRMQ